MLFSEKQFNEHPHKYNLLGISKLLSDYQIDNAGTLIIDKEHDILNIEAPFIAQVAGDFAVVSDVSLDSVSYRLNGLNIKLATNQFCEMWTGIVLLAEKTTKSIEPSYKENKRKIRFQTSLYLILAFLFLFSFVMGIMKQWETANAINYFTMSLNFMGIIICLFLLQKQIKIDGKYSDKICSLFRKSDCNNLLDSYNTKIGGIFTLSEIGFAFFTSNFILITFFPHLLNYYFSLAVIAVPFTFWSIWYQGFKAKQWCLLCLIIQVIIWLNFLTSLFIDFLDDKNPFIISFLCFSSIYLIPLITTNLLMFRLSGYKRTESAIQEINSLKATDGVLEALLLEQSYFDTRRDYSSIIFGNKDADVLITILSNPHCNPCGKMHIKIEDLLNYNSQHLAIQYIFTSFNEDLEISSKFLIAAYLRTTDDNQRSLIFNEWFKFGNLKKEEFFSKFSFDLNDDDVLKEFEAHKSWNKNAKIEATPTILVEGYKLPPNYKIDDFKYISAVNVIN
jgi:uncharacterized membrane protein